MTIIFPSNIWAPSPFPAVSTKIELITRCCLVHQTKQKVLTPEACFIWQDALGTYIRC